MPSIVQSINVAALTSLQTSLQSGSIEEFHQFINAESHLDISSFWTRAIQANDSVNATAACKAVASLLVKIDGEKGFTTPGAAFVRRVLVEHSKSIFRNLSSLRAMYVNPTLRMLLTMSQFDAGALASEVYVAMDFNTFQVLPKLLKSNGSEVQKPAAEKVALGKRKREDGSTKGGSRGLFIALIFTLLNHVESAQKAEILQRRPVVTELIKHLRRDSDTSVLKTLAGFTTILESRDIPRPAKVHFFNEWTLCQLLSLYQRTVPEEEGGPSLRQALQKFLVKVTTIPDQGICFLANGLIPPPNKKLFNPILSSFLSSLKPLADELQYDLLLLILKTTPELIAPWIQTVNLDLTPRLEVQWIQAMGLLESVLAIPLPEATLGSLSSIPTYVLLENIVPSALAKVLVKALQHDSDLVKLMTCRTLLKSMVKAKSIRRGSEEACDFVEALQQRVPLVEHVLPVTNTKLDSESSEEEVLLRETAIGILASYVNLFEDLQGFDFAGLFDLIMVAATRESDQMTDIGVAQASTVEKETVLEMARDIDGLQWLSKKRGTDSVLRVMIRYICSLADMPNGPRHAAIQVLDTIIRRDSFMFCTECPCEAENWTPAPVAKVEALIKALDACEENSDRADCIDFIEECMIRFQASPYKYWDLLMGARTDQNAESSPEFSPILLAFHEQLVFAKEKPFIQQWFHRVVALLVSVGEDQSLARLLLNKQTLKFAPDQDTVSLWSAVASLVRTQGGQTGGPHSVSLWRDLRSILSNLNSEEQRLAKRFALDKWRTFGRFMNQETTLEALQTLANCWTRADFEELDQTEGVMIMLLLGIESDPEVSLRHIVSSLVAQRMLDKALSQNGTTARYNVIASLIDCLDTDAKLLASHLEKLEQQSYLHKAPILSSMSGALRRSAVEAFDAHNCLATVFNSLHSSTSLAATERELAYFMQSVYSTYKTTTLPRQCIDWLYKASFSSASIVISAIFERSVPENRQIAESYLGSKEFSTEALDDQAATVQAVERCLAIKAASDPAFAALLTDQILHKLSATSDAERHDKKTRYDLMPISVSELYLLSRMNFSGSTQLPEDQTKLLAKLHRDIIQYLTRQFVEERTQRSTEVITRLLAFLKVVRDYIRTSRTFTEDVGNLLLDLLITSVLEAQSHLVEVFQVLLSLVQSTEQEAFNYTRAIQMILADPSFFRDAELKSVSIGLLHAMILQDPTKSSLGVMDAILKLYTGTINVDDLLLFEILAAIEQALSISLGSRINSWRFCESLSDTTDEKTDGAVLSSELALSTILHFAEHGNSLPHASTPNDHRPCYDLRYLLPLIAGYLHSDSSITMMKQLIEHHALGLAFIGLSSDHSGIRCSASYLLSRFNKLVLSSTIREKAQLETLFNNVRNSISSTDIENSPIERVQAVFLALAAHLLMNPSHFLYEKVNHYMLARPQLDMADIPLFLNLFYSSENYSKELGWLLRLLTAGVSETSEKVYGRRHVLELCMGLFRSKSTTSRTREAIAELLSRSLQEAGMRRYFEHVGGKVWLASDDDPDLAPIRAILSRTQESVRQI